MGCFWSKANDDETFHHHGSVHRRAVQVGRSTYPINTQRETYIQGHTTTNSDENHAYDSFIRSRLNIVTDQRLQNRLASQYNVNNILQIKPVSQVNSQQKNGIYQNSVTGITHKKTTESVFCISRPTELVKECVVRPTATVTQCVVKPIVPVKQCVVRPTEPLKQYTGIPTKTVKEDISGLKFVNNISIDKTKFRSVNQNRKTIDNSASTEEPEFGVYKCKCGRWWHSRLCWPDKYQLCKKCRQPVYPDTHRELKLSDMIEDKANAQEHIKELCQMCQKLGYYCGFYNKEFKNKLYSKKKQGTKEL